jgi:hypothetical protein
LSDNYIVLRASPDWLRFDLDESREFCGSRGMPEDLVVRYADRWQRTFGQDYREFRHEMKEIALASIAACRNCRFLTGRDQLKEPADEDLIVFMDDDDWLAPHLFEILRAGHTPHDGFLWGSIFLGKFLVDRPGLPVGSPALHLRALDDAVNTNNYAVTGRSLKRLTVPKVFEHRHAQRQLNAGDFAPQRISHYLSCANKHPCCTMWPLRNLQVPNFLDRLRETVSDYESALRAIEVSPDIRWIDPYLRQLRAVVAKCLGAATA